MCSQIKLEPVIVLLLFIYEYQCITDILLKNEKNSENYNYIIHRYFIIISVNFVPIGLYLLELEYGGTERHTITYIQKQFRKLVKTFQLFWKFLAVACGTISPEIFR